MAENAEAAAMTTPPARPKLYHITHVDNLRKIVADGELLSDAAMIARGGPAQAIGMSGIKRRRVEELAGRVPASRTLPVRADRAHRRSVRGNPGARCDSPRGHTPSAGNRAPSGVVLLRQEARR